MSKEDILQKWLNLAYSIKRVQNTQNNRLQAGNKGIGRFSCDRLGKELNIYTKRDSEIYQLQINWEDFENITDYNVQINQIPMKLRKITADEVKKETDYDIGVSGTTILVASFLRVSDWMSSRYGNSLFVVLFLCLLHNVCTTSNSIYLAWITNFGLQLSQKDCFILILNA